MTAKQAELARSFGVDPPYPPDLTIPPPELFPKRPAWIVREHDGRRILDIANWGFPPPQGARAPVTNVRNLASPFWRSALALPGRRCLVPVSAFCEYEGAPGAKVACWFRLRECEVFAFAGLWRPVENGKAYAFLTCEPNPLVGAVHPKAMPVILEPDDYGRWLRAPRDEAVQLATPYPSQLMATE